MEKNIFSANEIWDINELPFEASDYSKFKFGSKSAARQFGKELAMKFYKRRIRDLRPKEQIVVYPSPYNFIPTATGIMKDYFIRYLNEYLIDSGLNPVEEGKIHRNTTYREDYGTMSAEERMKLIGNDKFYIDSEFCKGKLLVFIDDIKITGSHEVMVEKMCREQGITNKCFFIYYASLNDPEISPTFENDLNYASVKSLLDINSIIRNDEFIPNTRVVKFILNSNSDDCKNFLQYQGEKFLDNLWHLAIGNLYHEIPEYKENLNLLRSLLI